MIIFKPSQVHQGHYVYINDESTDIVVNLFAYKTIDEYKKQIDEKIENFKTNNYVV
jgi:predicted nucleotide-binding protein (sugar kinase/HSP70/actin superfamily)